METQEITDSMVLEAITAEDLAAAAASRASQVPPVPPTLPPPAKKKGLPPLPPQKPVGAPPEVTDSMMMEMITEDLVEESRSTLKKAQPKVPPPPGPAPRKK
jgi:hypothetical protein